MLNKRVAVAAMLVAALAVTSCARVHHIATVTVISAHSTIALVQDAADLTVCGQPTSPSPCMTEAVRKGPVSAALKQALDLDIAMLTTVRNWPDVPGTFPDVAPYVTKINALLAEVIAAMPEGTIKARLILALGGKA